MAVGYEGAVGEVTVELRCSPYAAVCGLEVLESRLRCFGVGTGLEVIAGIVSATARLQWMQSCDRHQALMATADLW